MSEVREVTAWHAAPDAPDKWIMLNGMAGYVCSVCGDPVESEPCREHQPLAYAQCTGIWEQKRRERIGADCRDGKHLACIGDAWDTEADCPADCECGCHHDDA